ncbi:MFS transporter [Paraburkholderia sp. J12]|uniref:MFS transporter n=1 Tax=Paraburkholderia sp. J12 TaxID=2805432 RepID=UPI002ABD7177|nr:MFS transporter [Paraburkholderia sp. J12]
MKADRPPEVAAGTRGLALYLAGRFLIEAAALAQATVTGWLIYRLYGAPLALGMIGLVQFVPMALLTLPAGEWCDRLSPRRLLIAGLALQAVCALLFAWLACAPVPGLGLFYALLFASGAARAVIEPAGQALLPGLVNAAVLPRAIARSSAVWQIAVIAGPALGGAACVLGAPFAYATCGLALLASIAATVALRAHRVAPVERATLKTRLARVREGLRFVRSQPVVLGAISLDLFAVLLGGASALLPVYARDILHTDSFGLGLLRSAPAAGACLMALLQSHRPPRRTIGLQLFAAVAAFGLATLVFAFSTSCALSLAALALLGASDMVSVNIRTTLVQLATPEAMRGRVAAVNMLFIGASSELGAFESGVAAALFGTVAAVAIGGAGTLAVAAVWMRLFPALRKADRLPTLQSVN